MDYSDQQALLRAADQRTARAANADPLRSADNPAYGLETSHQRVAQTVGGGKSPPPLAAHPAQRGAEHGLRGRAGELGAPGSGTRTSPDAVGYLKSRQNRLNCDEAGTSVLVSCADRTSLRAWQWRLDQRLRRCGKRPIDMRIHCASHYFNEAAPPRGMVAAGGRGCQPRALALGARHQREA